MSTQLDIFAQRFGDERTPATRLTVANDNSLGEAGLKMLQAVQTVVDVLAPEGSGYRVGFAATSAAFTDHKTRRITITGLPLLDAKPGTPYRDIAAVLTGFAVHEVGHVKRVGIIDAVRKEWPDKMLPKTLGNIIEDVVLEARVIERYAGFLHVFDAAFEWVAEKTCPKHPLQWKGSTGNRVNVAGQIVRYRDYVTFTDDEPTKSALKWWDEWASRINAKTGPKEGVALVREALAYLKATADDEQPVEPPVLPPGPDGPKGPKLPDEDEPKPPSGTKPGTPDEEPDDEEPPTPTEGGDEPGGDDGENPTGGGDDDGDGENPEGGDDDGGDDEGGDHGGSIADTEHRIDLGEQTNDGAGSGGSGQGVGKSSDDDGSDPDDFNENELLPDLDSVIDNVRGEDYTLQGAVDEERTTTRMEAGIHGKMRVIWK